MEAVRQTHHSPSPRHSSSSIFLAMDYNKEQWKGQTEKGLGLARLLTAALVGSVFDRDSKPMDEGPTGEGRGNSKKLSPPELLPGGTSSAWHSNASNSGNRDTNDDDETWGFGTGQFIPMYSWPSSAPPPPPRIPYYPFTLLRNRKKSGSHRRLCILGLSLGLLFSSLLGLFLILSTHQSSGPEVFDGSKGPRGQRPGPAPAAPLPVKGILRPVNKSTEEPPRERAPRLYLGMAIDWVILILIWKHSASHAQMPTDSR